MKIILCKTIFFSSFPLVSEKAEDLSYGFTVDVNKRDSIQIFLVIAQPIVSITLLVVILLLSAGTFTIFRLHSVAIP